MINNYANDPDLVIGENPLETGTKTVQAIEI
jgi:hypothetical protein